MQDIQDLLEGLRRAPKILSEFVKSIPEAKLDLRRGEAMVAFFIGRPILCAEMTCYNRFKKRLLSALPKGHEEK